MFYDGKVCEKHPHAGGLRYRSCRKCVHCHNIDAAQARRDAIKQATPDWADKKAIAEIYRKAEKKGKAVDHVIPLNHKKVCGLHVHQNLKAVSGPANLAKGNKFRVITSKPKEVK